MDIKELDSTTIYSKTIRNVRFEINGKIVRVEIIAESDSVFENYETDYAFNPEDEKLLTEEESEALAERITK